MPLHLIFIIHSLIILINLITYIILIDKSIDTLITLALFKYIL